MALDKLVDSSQLDTDLTAVANAIRTKGDTSAALAFPTGFVDAVEAIETGGGGGGDPQYGLITEINISSPVSEIRYSLPDLVLANGKLFVVLKNITLSADDWLYTGIVPSNASAVSAGLYSLKASSVNDNQTFAFSDPKTIGNETFVNLRSGRSTVYTGQGRSYLSSKDVNGANQFNAVPYTGGITIVSGIIQLYGRIA